MRAAALVACLALFGLAAGNRINDELPTLRRELSSFKYGKSGVPAVNVAPVTFTSSFTSVPSLPTIPVGIVSGFQTSVLELLTQNLNRITRQVNLQVGTPILSVRKVVSGLAPQFSITFGDAFVAARAAIASTGVSLDSRITTQLTEQLLKSLEITFLEAFQTTLPGFQNVPDFDVVFNTLPGRVVQVLVTSPVIVTAGPSQIANLVKGPFTRSLEDIFKVVVPGFFGKVKIGGSKRGNTIRKSAAVGATAGPGQSVTVSTDGSVPAAPSTTATVVSGGSTTPVVNTTPDAIVVTSTSNDAVPQGVSTVVTPGGIIGTSGGATVVRNTPSSTTTVSAASTTDSTGNSATVSGSSFSGPTVIPAPAVNNGGGATVVTSSDTQNSGGAAVVNTGVTTFPRATGASSVVLPSGNVFSAKKFGRKHGGY